MLKVYLGCGSYTQISLPSCFVGILLGEKAVNKYSLISLGLFIPESSATPDGFGIRFIQVSCLLFQRITLRMWLVVCVIILLGDVMRHKYTFLS